METITEDQPALPNWTALTRYAATIRNLVAASEAAGPELDLDGWFDLPAYSDALEQAYALQMVHSDLSADGFDMIAINSRPEEILGRLELPELRRYVHALWRCERHTHPHGSLVLDAVQSGALGLVASLLEARSNLPRSSSCVTA